jgi:alpha-tubulin suppressor-like RCC1 family protein
MKEMKKYKRFALLLIFIVGTGPLFMSFLEGPGNPWPLKPKFVLGLGEYQCFIINTETGKLYGISNNLSTLGLGSNGGIPALPSPVAVPDDLSFRAVASGLHNSLAVDHNGEVWTWGDNGNGEAGIGEASSPGLTLPAKIKSDSLGRPFRGVVQVVVWSTNNSNGNAALKADGTVWVWGLTGGGMRGNGQTGQVNPSPVQVLIPENKKITQIAASDILMALASDGSVYTWGGNNRKELLGTNSTDYTHPHRVPLPQPAKEIQAGGFFYYALGIRGNLYGWGYYTASMCMGAGGYDHALPPPLRPHDLTNDLRLPHPIARVTTNSIATHVILTDGTLWGWGDNSSGTVGNGQELDYIHHNPPYAWSWAPGEMLVQKPCHLVAGVSNFIQVFGGSAGVFYSYAETSDGKLYSWGRNKTAVLGNGIMGPTPEIISVYPNSWDVLKPTIVDPFALKSSRIQNSPYCKLHPDASPCNQYREPTQ